MAGQPTQYVLRTESPDSVGILASVTSFLAERGCSILESHDFGDPVCHRFFIWIRMNCPQDFHPRAFEDQFADLAEARAIEFALRPADQRPRALIMVSKMDHCLNDLLFRHHHNRLGADVVALVSNHEDARWHAERHELPFHHVPVSADTKAQAEAKLLELINDTQADFIVLARYMQVLSDGLCRQLEGRCINIHHSALPSFKGARPYHQAHQRGVKLIGATAHYVTPDLDEGPIISQEAVKVDHRAGPERLIEMGRDIEARVLAHAVRAHAEGRVFLSGARTVVFD